MDNHLSRRISKLFDGVEIPVKSLLSLDGLIVDNIVLGLAKVIFTLKYL